MTSVPEESATTEPAPEESSAVADDAVAAEAADQSVPDDTEAVPADAPEAGETAPAAEDAAEQDGPASEAPESDASESADASDKDAAAEPESVPAPAPIPRPLPRPVAPLPRAPRPSAPATSAPAETASTGEWGRVDDDGTVSVREGDEWRVVGQYPDGTPVEALAYFERKFADLASEVALIEARHRGGGASAADLRSTVKTVRERVTGAAAVGDIASLEGRLDALDEALSEASAEEAAAHREAVDAAIAERTALVEQIEEIAGRDPKSIQWKQTSAEVTALFERWQAHQATGPRLPKNIGQQLWKRFRDARAIFDKHRREFYAGLDETHKSARDAKAALVERAEALASKGEDGIATYRSLLDQWKSAGRAGKKADDALWARFKAAGDALYSARADREHADAEASKEKIEAKKALLQEAAAVAKEKDTAKARAILTGIQRRWDDIGRVFPREAERALDDDLRKVEQAVKAREESDWKSNNPETKARQNDMTQQLRDAIAKLEDEVAAAVKTKDKAKIAKAEEALAARKAWLSALGG